MSEAPETASEPVEPTITFKAKIDGVAVGEGVACNKGPMDGGKLYPGTKGLGCSLPFDMVLPDGTDVKDMVMYKDRYAYWYNQLTTEFEYHGAIK